jgi:hypothetical protein
MRLIGPAGEKNYTPKLPASVDKFQVTFSPDTATYLSGYKKGLLAVRISCPVKHF